MKSSFGGDPVENDSEHGGKRNSDLFTGARIFLKSLSGTRAQRRGGPGCYHEEHHDHVGHVGGETVLICELFHLKGKAEFLHFLSSTSTRLTS